MIVSFLALFVALAGCQAVLAVKLADWLSPVRRCRARHRPSRSGTRGAVRLA